MTLHLFLLQSGSLLALGFPEAGECLPGWSLKPCSLGETSRQASKEEHGIPTLFSLGPLVSCEKTCRCNVLYIQDHRQQLYLCVYLRNTCFRGIYSICVNLLRWKKLAGVVVFYLSILLGCTPLRFISLNKLWRGYLSEPASGWWQRWKRAEASCKPVHRAATRPLWPSSCPEESTLYFKNESEFNITKIR